MTTYDYTKPDETKKTPINEIGGIISMLGGIGNNNSNSRFNDADIIVHSVLMAGRIAGKTSWSQKPSWWHLYRAVRHILLWIIRNKDDSHLINAMTRCYMVIKREQALQKIKDEDVSKKLKQDILYTILEEGEN